MRSNSIAESNRPAGVGLTVLLASLMVFGTGCGGHGDRPKLGQVTGMVTLDGQPLPQATIFFDPETGGRSSTATTDDSGRYELTYTIDAMGAKVGRHQVRISTFIAPETDSKFPKGMEEKVPEKYRTDGALSGEVEAGDNIIDFYLTSS